MTETSQNPAIPKTNLAAINDELTAEGEPIHPGLYDKLDDDPRLLDVLASRIGADLKEYIRHSNRYQIAARREPIFGKVVAIPPAVDNLHGDGQSRRHEEGPMIDLDAVRQAGVDPDHVLYFRVTQPSEIPCPEYYWTSDFSEVRNGLNRELGDTAETAVILVSTLGHIAQNGGLIRDINDDGGVAVRQIGLAPFDQRSALGVIPRNT